MILSDTNHQITLATDRGTPLATITHAHRFEYIRRANDVGGFELMLPADFDASLVEAGADRRVEFWRKPAGGTLALEFVGFVEKTAWKTDGNGFTTLHVTGRHVASLLGRRIVPAMISTARYQKSTYADDMMKALVDEAFLAGAVNPLRQLTGYLTLAPDLSQGPVISLEFPWSNLLDALIDCADAAAERGTRVYFDVVPITSQVLQFQTYINQRGADRRRQHHARPVVFSQEFGNLEMPALEYDEFDTLTVVWASGGGAGTQQLVQTAYDTILPFRSIFGWREGHVSTQADTAAKATERAYVELWSHRPRISFDAVLKDSDQARYGLDWFFGDQVSISGFGIQSSVHADLVRIAVDEDGAETVEAMTNVSSE